MPRKSYQPTGLQPAMWVNHLGMGYWRERGGLGQADVHTSEEGARIQLPQKCEPKAAPSFQSFPALKIWLFGMSPDF